MALLTNINGDIMDILSLIEKKKLGLTLSNDEIEWFVLSLDNIADYQISAFLMAIRINGMSDSETCALAYAMANSGDTLSYPADIHNLTVDKHSTGGVGDTTSLVIMPILATLSLYMPKMSGRSLGLTGGTIDKLEAIDGFQTDMSEDKMIDGLLKNHGVICGQTKSLAPADKVLYAIRDTSGTIDSIPLIAASIMSKKLAGGAQNIVLDVKVGSGAFMKNADDAVTLGELMRVIGDKAGRNVSYVVSDMDRPLSRFIGNAPEVYGAILTLMGEKNALSALSVKLATKLAKLAGLKCSESEIYNIIDSGQALNKFRDIVEFSGGDTSFVDCPDKLLKGVKTIDICAEKDGYIADISAENVAKTVFDMGVGRKRKTDKVNLRAGVEFVKVIGDNVRQGECIAKLFITEPSHEIKAKDILNAITFTSEKVTPNPLVLKESD